MNTSASTPNSSMGQQTPPILRKLLIAIAFAITNILIQNRGSHGSSEYDFSSLLLPSFSFVQHEHHSLTSGVGLVTTDGMWGEDVEGKYKDEDIKILGFTDRNYLPIAKWWYNRLTMLVSTIKKVLDRNCVCVCPPLFSYTSFLMSMLHNM